MGYLIEYRARPGDVYRISMDSATGQRRVYDKIDEAEKAVVKLFEAGIVARVVDERYRK